MTWFTWRQFRLQAPRRAGVARGHGSVLRGHFGPHLWSEYDSLRHCSAHGDCASLNSSVSNGYSKVFPFVQALVIARCRGCSECSGEHRSSRTNSSPARSDSPGPRA